jgi:hypothetical protein
MAIVFDAATSGGRGFGNTRVFAHTIGANDHRILMVGHTISVNAVLTTTFAGIAMDLVDVAFNVGQMRTHLYKMVNPPVGANNVVIFWTGNTAWSCGAVSYDGVDPIAFGPAVTNTGADNTPTVVAASIAGELVVDAAGYRRGSTTLNVGGGQIARVNTGSGVGDLTGHGQSEEAGAPAVTMSWTIAAGAFPWAIVALPLKSFASARGRATKYFFPFWNAAPKLFDANGKIVDPSDILADEWVEAEGLGFPTAENPESFIEDPSRSKIIEVNASQASARIKTNTNQFAEVLVSRVAAGS